MSYAIRNDGMGWRAVANAAQIGPDEYFSAAIPAKPLAQVKDDKVRELEAAYAAACQQPVSYMGATFQADYGSQEILTKTLASLNPAGGVPQGFAWWATDNSAVPMTLAELNGLAMAMLIQGWAAFQNKQAKNAAARAAATVEQVEAVSW